METWEYKKVSFVADDEVLNTYGKKGWEAFSAFKEGDCTVVLMKRRSETKIKTKKTPNNGK